MGQSVSGQYMSSPTAMSENQRRNHRLTKSGALVVASENEVLNFTPVLDTSIYADNDVLFIATEIPNFVRVAGGRSLIKSVHLFDGDDQGVDVTLFLTQNATTPGTINAAISAADTVMDDIQTSIRIVAADYEDLINSQVASVGSINKMVEAAAASTSLYCWGAVRSGTPTYTASGMIIRFGVEYLD
jgi:hypothetical protein